MQFLDPGKLGWFWLLVPLVLMFLVRRRPKQVKVSTLAFFKSLAQVYRESPWLRRLKRLLALLIAAATLGGGVWALAHLVVAPDAGELRSVVVVIDGSASMLAVDGDGRARIDVARERVRERLAGLGSEVGVLLMRYDRSPEILMPTTYDRRDLLRTLETVRARPVEGDGEAALHLAARLAALSAPAAIWHVSDTPLLEALGDEGGPPEDEAPTDEAPTDEAPKDETPKDGDEATTDDDGTAPTAADRLDLPAGVTLTSIDVGLPRPANVGLTAFQIRPRPLERGRFDAFVEIQGQGQGTLETSLEVRMDGTLVALRELSIPAGGSERLVVPIEATTGAALELRVKTDGDVLPTDDRVLARVPPARPVRLLWVRSPEAADPFTQLALMALGEEGILEAHAAAPAAFDPEDDAHDVVIFDGWLPETWPTTLPALVIKPPRPVGPVRVAPIEGAGLPVDSLRAVDESHPVLYGVASDRVAVTQTAVLDAEGSLTPLWTGAMGPLLAAGEVKGQRIVVMAFAADRSERLGMMASYPLMLGNAVFWLAEDDEAARQGHNLRTGEVLDNPDGATLSWRAEGPGEGAPASPPIVELDRLGLWQLGEVQGSASLLSRKETMIPARAGAEGDDGAHAEAGGLRGDLRPFLLWLVLGLLVLEAWLFHRYAVY